MAEADSLASTPPDAEGGAPAAGAGVPVGVHSSSRNSFADQVRTVEAPAGCVAPRVPYCCCWGCGALHGTRCAYVRQLPLTTCCGSNPMLLGCW